MGCIWREHIWCVECCYIDGDIIWMCAVRGRNFAATCWAEMACDGVATVCQIAECGECAFDAHVIPGCPKVCAVPGSTGFTAIQTAAMAYKAWVCGALKLHSTAKAASLKRCFQWELPTVKTILPMCDPVSMWACAA